MTCQAVGFYLITAGARAADPLVIVRTMSGATANLICPPDALIDAQRGAPKVGDDWLKWQMQNIDHVVVGNIYVTRIKVDGEGGVSSPQVTLTKAEFAAARQVLHFVTQEHPRWENSAVVSGSKKRNTVTAQLADAPATPAPANRMADDTRKLAIYIRDHGAPAGGWADKAVFTAACLENVRPRLPQKRCIGLLLILLGRPPTTMPPPPPPGKYFFLKDEYLAAL